MALGIGHVELGANAGHALDGATAHQAGAFVR